MSHPPYGEEIDILLVEDNPGDVTLTREALKDGRIANKLHVVGNGIEAVQFLRKMTPFQDAPRPDLILLDLNLPKMSGHEVLAEIKKDPDLCVIPVVVLTTSEADEDILKSYSLHANAYITKPVGLQQFLDAVRKAGEFYVSIVKLPPHDGKDG